MNLRAFKGEVLRAYRLHGVKGILSGARTALTGKLPAFRPTTTATVADDEFDSLYGVSTGGAVRLSELEIGNDNWVYGQRYEPVPMQDFIGLMHDLNISFEEFSFIDMGSGKGRAVLLAAMLPFKKVVGIELSERLVDISRNNVKIFRKDLIRCNNIEIICQDASLYDIPSDGTVVFLNNPFRLNIFRKVIDSIAMSKGRLIIIYYNTINDDGCVSYLDSIESFTKTIESRNHAVFTN